MKKKMLIPICLGILALVLLLIWAFLPEPPAPAAPVPTVPAPQEQTEPVITTVPAGTAPAETEPPATTAPAETVLQPEQTEPEQTDPPETRPLQTDPPETEPMQTEPSAGEPELFPVLLEDGMLTVQSMFLYSGINPDAELAFGENIAGLQVMNTSDLHLREAELTALLEDGTALTFLVEDLAPGMSAMAFSLEHGSLKDIAQCVDVYGYAEFEEGDPLRLDLVELRIDGVEITVKNVSGEDLTDLTIFCHGLLDGSNFGGKAYAYRINSLSAGASTVIRARDCILGVAQVARVELGG